MNSQNRSDGGVPRRSGAVPGKRRPEETWVGANEAKDEKLRLRKVTTVAGEDGLEVRHSDYGYSLIDADRKPVNGRNDMTLKEIESYLKIARKR